MRSTGVLPTAEAVGADWGAVRAGEGWCAGLWCRGRTEVIGGSLPCLAAFRTQPLMWTAVTDQSSPHGLFGLSLADQRRKMHNRASTSRPGEMMSGPRGGPRPTRLVCWATTATTPRRDDQPRTGVQPGRWSRESAKSSGAVWMARADVIVFHRRRWSRSPVSVTWWSTCLPDGPASRRSAEEGDDEHQRSLPTGFSGRLHARMVTTTLAAVALDRAAAESSRSRYRPFNTSMLPVGKVEIFHDVLEGWLS